MIEIAGNVQRTPSGVVISRTTTLTAEEDDTNSSVQRSFLTEWWGRYGNQLTATGDSNNYFQLPSHSLSLMATPTRDRNIFITPAAATASAATPELSPLTQYFERTIQEIPGVQFHRPLEIYHRNSLNDNDEAISLEILLQELNSMNSPTGARTGTGTGGELLRADERNEFALLKQEVMRLSAESEDQKRMSELREQELIRILKENDELVRARGDNDVLVEEKLKENENLKKRVWELKSELEEIVTNHQRESRKLQRLLEQKKSDLCQQEEVIRRQEVELLEKFQSLQTTKEKVATLQETLQRYEESRGRDLHEEKQERERERREYLQEMKLLKEKSEQQERELRERDLQEKVLEESHLKIKMESEEFKRRYEKLESELMDTIRALNQKDLQYSVIFQQHQEMLREKQELNEAILQFSQQQPPHQQEVRSSRNDDDVHSIHSISTPSPTASPPESTVCHHCRESSPLAVASAPSLTTTPTDPMVTTSPSPLLLIHEKESILMLTEQLDSIMKETERRESEWNSRHRELELLVHEWRLKANTAMTQVISLKEQTLHILREKKIMEHELSQNWDLIHHQRNEIYDLQQIVENLALEAQRTTQDVHRRSSRSSLFPIPQGHTPLTRSLLDCQDQQQQQEQCDSTPRDPMGSSSETSLSTWSQIIPRVNQRRNEEEQKEMRIDDALFLELIKIQGLDDHKEIVLTHGDTHRHHYPQPLLPQPQCEQHKLRRVQFPEKGYQFLIKLLIRIWKKSRGGSAKDFQTKGSQPPPSSISPGTNTKTLISALSKSEFNGNIRWDNTEASSPPSPFMLLNPPPSPPRPRSSFDSIFDLLGSSPPPTALVTSSPAVSSNHTVTHSTITSRTSIYQNFLSENHVPSSVCVPSRSSIFSITHSPFEDLDHGGDDNPDPLLGEDDEEVILSEDDDILSVDEGDGHEKEREEGGSFYISSSSYSERSDQTSSPLPGHFSPHSK
jgi:hypothetical protein